MVNYIRNYLTDYKYAGKREGIYKFALIRSSGIKKAGNQANRILKNT